MLSAIFQKKDRIFYGWVIVASVVILSFIMMGINSSFGVLFKSLESTFHMSRAETSAILSGRMILSGVFTFLGGWATDRYGPRIVLTIMGLFTGLSLILTAQTTAVWQLYITYSLLLAVGVGAAYVVMASTVLRWFDRKQGLAFGIAGSGGGLGVAFVVPFSAFLIGNFEWRNALMILAGIAWLVILPVSQLLKKNPYKITSLPYGATSAYQTLEVKQSATSSQRVLLLRMLRTANFWFFLSIRLLRAFSLSFVMTHIIPHAVDLGFSAIEAATILSFSGIAMIVGGLIAGIITDKLGAKVVAIICFLLKVVVFLGLVWVQELWMLYLFGLVFGFTSGGIATVLTIFVGRILGLDDIGKILGAIDVGIYIGSAIGPLLGGFIFDTFNNYTLAFLIVVGTLLARILLVVLIKQKMGEDR